jgi:hypothetical protein
VGRARLAQYFNGGFRGGGKVGLPPSVAFLAFADRVIEELHQRGRDKGGMEGYIEQIIGAGGAGVNVGDQKPVGGADELPRKLALINSVLVRCHSEGKFKCHCWSPLSSCQGDSPGTEKGVPPATAAYAVNSE